jgi:hypothetical protein
MEPPPEDRIYPTSSVSTEQNTKSASELQTSSVSTEQNTKSASELQIKAQMDSLLRKYIRVWIWSILFGLNTTLTLSLTVQRFGDRYVAGIALVLAIPSLISAAANIFSWSYLALFLRKGLMPLLMPEPHRPEYQSDVEQYQSDVEHESATHTRYLYTAMLFAIFAVISRAFGFLVEATFSSLGNI